MWGLFNFGVPLDLVFSWLLMSEWGVWGREYHLDVLLDFAGGWVMELYGD